MLVVSNRPSCAFELGWRHDWQLGSEVHAPAPEPQAAVAARHERRRAGIRHQRTSRLLEIVVLKSKYLGSNDFVGPFRWVRVVVGGAASNGRPSLMKREWKKKDGHTGRGGAIPIQPLSHAFEAIMGDWVGGIRIYPVGDDRNGARSSGIITWDSAVESRQVIPRHGRSRIF